MKYLVKTHCLERHNIGYIVEANSEKEAEELAKSEGYIYYHNYDTTEHDIESIEKYED